MSPLEILRLGSADPQIDGLTPEARAAWRVYEAPSAADAARELRERFFHVVVVDQALAGEFLWTIEHSFLDGGSRYPYPRERVLVVLEPRERRPRWGCDLPRAGALLEPPWRESLEGFLAVHPALAASAWRNFQLSDPLRLDEDGLREALLSADDATRQGAIGAVLTLLQTKQPVGRAGHHLADLLTPPYDTVVAFCGLVRCGVEVPEVRPLTGWLAGVPLLGLRRLAWALLDHLDVSEGRAVMPTPREGLSLPAGCSLQGVSLHPTLADSVDGPTSESSRGLPCGACGSAEVIEVYAEEQYGADGGTPAYEGMRVELRCAACGAYSAYWSE
jgi:hypothetical protein